MQHGSRQQDMRSLVRRVFSEREKEPFLLLNLLRQYWPQVVGPELAAKTQPRRLERGTLWIAATDACWAYELQFFKAELLNSVQTFLESRTVSDLRFLAAPVDPPAESAAAAAPPAAHAPPQPQRPTVPARAAKAPAALQRPADAEVEAPAALTRAAATIGDAALRSVFQRSLAKQRQGWERRSGAGSQDTTEAAAGPSPKDL